MEWSTFPATRLAAAATRVDITPPGGIRLHNWAYSPHQIATGVHRPLFASICALDTVDGRALLISLDLGWWMNSGDEAQVRDAVLAAANLPAERVIIALSHTHAGPSLARADSNSRGGDLIAPYLDHVTELLTAEASGLFDRLEPAILEWSYGKCDLAVNRDLYLPEEARFVVGANPSGETDDTLLVGRLTSSLEPRTMAVVVNYAAHPTSLGGLNSLLSPDYPGATRELVERETGGVFLFLQGASGDLAPKRQYDADVAVADSNGRVLGYAVLSTLAAMPAPGTALRYLETIESGAPLGIFTVVPARQADRCGFVGFDVSMGTQHNDPPACGDAAVSADRKLRADRVKSNVAEGEVQFPVTAWQLGAATVFAYPGEAYSSLQRGLRRAAQERPVVVVNLANGAHQGYLPPRTAYVEGRYPAWQTPLAPGSLERLATACEQHLSQPCQIEEAEQK